MKIVLFSRPQVAYSPQDLERLFALIEHYGFDFAINEEFAERVKELIGRQIAPNAIYSDSTGEQPHPSVMMCLGGDGTLLEGVHRLSDKSIPVAGVNFGHLGFLSASTREGLETLFEDIAHSRIKTEPRTMLAIELESRPKECITALNELSVHRMEATMLRIEAKVNSQRVSQFSGDGVILSTPTGSTAYSLSAGGPIVAPACGCFLLTPLAPHNFGMRTVVLPDNAEIELGIHSRHGGAMLSIDNRALRIADGEKIFIKRAEEQILLVTPHNISFYEALHSKMMWDADIRN